MDMCQLIHILMALEEYFITKWLIGDKSTRKQIEM